jgi:hypothetical protein
MRTPGSLDLTRTRVIGAGGWDRIAPIHAFFYPVPDLFLRMTRPGLISGAFKPARPNHSGGLENADN